MIVGACLHGELASFAKLDVQRTTIEENFTYRKLGDLTRAEGSRHIQGDEREEKNKDAR
jgi:hypothetical protein